MSNSTATATASCSTARATTAGELLLLAAAAVPPSHYLLALLLFIIIFLYNFLECHLISDIFLGRRGDPISLTFDPESHIYQGIVSKCRALHGRYLATPWLASPHLQTMFLNFFGRPPAFTYNRQLYTTQDGGTVALDWLLVSDVAGGNSYKSRGISKDDSTPLVVVIPGLTSDSASPYLKHLVYAMAKHGWNVVVSNHRGLGGISITSDCFYNAGWTEDAREIINYLHKEYPKSPLFAIGTSIGANVLVKYLGEEGENTPVAGASAICSPWDLVVCDRFITRNLAQKLYDRALAIGLKGYAQLHEPVLSRLANWEGISKSKTVRDFDNHATCLVAKYETVDTYYRRCSSVSYVGHVSVPLLCISALDDPVCTREAIPWDECRANKNIVLATAVHGGHLAFFEGLFGNRLWWVGAVREFLSVLHNSPYMHHQRKTEDVGLHSSLESTIDKTPYVNVTEDGMLAGVTNNNETNYEITPEQDTNNNNNNRDESVISQQKQTVSTKEKTIYDEVTPIIRSLNRVTRYQGRSVWLLAYIAVVTSWPLIGSLAFLFFRKRVRNGVSN